MNRITKLFESGKKDILSVYYTAGYPHLDDTLKIAEALQEAGADMLEIGFPFSDPLADGPTIQQSSEQALKNGMSVKLLFEQLKALRPGIRIPVLLMGYLNPVMQYGIKAFCARCGELGVDGLILPDLPMNEYEETYRPVFERNHLSNVFLVTPESSEARIRKIDELTEGFIYALSSSSTTGKEMDGSDRMLEYFRRLQEMKLKNPLLVGFGISDRKSFRKAVSYSGGAIIGSAFIRLLREKGVSYPEIEKFISKITA